MLTTTPRRAEIEARFAKARAIAASAPPHGRLIFALDATMSRQPTWDTACQLQADMFREAAAIGGLEVQLVYFRGMDECRASRWVAQPEQLAELMERIHCRSGHTQIGKIFAHAKRESRARALVFVGDAMEERLDDLRQAAAGLSVPAFMFQEGDDPAAALAFREIARLTRGAYCHFDPGAAHQLCELLRAAAYAVGGTHALAGQRSTGAALMLQNLQGKH